MSKDIGIREMTYVDRRIAIRSLITLLIRLKVSSEGEYFYVTTYTYSSLNDYIVRMRSK